VTIFPENGARKVWRRKSPLWQCHQGVKHGSPLATSD
jgi:hypothetical protein